MRQIFLEKKSLLVKEASSSLLDEDSILISVHYSFFSLPEHIQAFEQCNKSRYTENIPQKVRHVLGAFITQEERPFQRLEHSCSGIVISVGKNIQNFKPGDLVACIGHDVAHYTDLLCSKQQWIVHVPSQEFLDSASVIAAGTRALQGIREGALQLGETACVIGLGIIGQFIIQLLKLSGCYVLAVDSSVLRREYAENNGADGVYSFLDEAALRDIHFATGGYGVDVVFIAESITSEEVQKSYCTITRERGRIIAVGFSCRAYMSGEAQKKGITFIASQLYGVTMPDDQIESEKKSSKNIVRWTQSKNMQTFIDLVKNGKINTSFLTRIEVDPNSLEESERVLKSSDSVGVIGHYQHNLAQSSKVEKVVKLKKKSSCNSFTFLPAVSDCFRVGVIGAGRFARGSLMPYLTSLKGVTLEAVVDANLTHSLNIARLYGANKAFVDDRELLEGNVVDVVFIASPHKFHCDQIIRALDAGKAVFVEKPMITNSEQLIRLMTFLNQHKNVPFCVDYSRSYAPFIQKIKKEINNRKTPLVIHYRVNAGFVPREHWTQTDVGAGRIIGEACHIIDLFYFLTDAHPISVSVEAVYARNDTVFSTDNFCVTISFDDGSVCSLLYTSLGHEKLGKERMEVFYDSKSIIMDDYEYLAGFGLARLFDETVTIPDQGHSELLSRFFKQLREKTFQPPIPLDRLQKVAELTLLIDRLVCEGGGIAQIEAMNIHKRL